MKTTLHVQNLKCAGCEYTIMKKLKSLKGVHAISIKASNGSISFGYTPEADLNVIEQELSRLGYPVVGDANSIGKKAKSYVSCALGKIQK